jgi:hypothetical protein
MFEVTPTAIGFLMVVLLKKVEGDHEYVKLAGFCVLVQLPNWVFGSLVPVNQTDVPGIAGPHATVTSL